ncbi:MAG: metallophosphoesterase [Thermodesulfovibrionales bacterium]
MKAFWRSIGIVLVLFLCSATVFAGIKKGPYLVYEGSNTSMAVLWQTDATESNIIHWGTDTTYSLGQAPSTEYGDHQHKVVIPGLHPNTKYYYKVDGYGLGSFHTAPDSSAKSVKILSYGDTRSRPESQELVVARMRVAYASDPAFQSIVLHSGDWVSGDGESYWTSQFFVNTNPQMHAFQSEVPIEGVRGNHEGAGTYFKKYFPYPYVNSFYWSFDYGPVHIVVLDQYVSYSPGSAQYNWLINDLASTTKPWKILMFHEPAWGAGGHENNTATQKYLQPLCKKYQIDLVLNGHNHYYARALVDGIPHITNGGGGAPLYTPDATYPNIVITDESLSYCEINIQDTTLALTARRADGSVIETFSLNHPVAHAGENLNTSFVVSSQTVLVTHF